MIEVAKPKETMSLSSSKVNHINPYEAMNMQEEEPPHHRSNKRKSSSRKQKREKSAVSRMSAASAVNRGEMKTIIESIRRDREEDISGRERCGKDLEETLRQFEEQRKALLVKWQAMSEQRRVSRWNVAA